MDETPYPAASGSSRRRRLAIHLIQQANAAVAAHASPAAPPTNCPRRAVESWDQWLQLVCRRERLTWLFTGDSLSVTGKSPGRGASHVSYLIRLIRDRLGRDGDAFVMTACPAQRLECLLQSFEDDISRFSPDIVVFSCGPQELDVHSQSLQEFEITIHRLIAQTRQSGATPIITTPPCTLPFSDPSLSTDRLIRLEAIRACALEGKAYLVDHWLHWEELAQPNWYRSDRQTPSDQGAVELAQLFIRELQLDQIPFNVHQGAKSQEEALPPSRAPVSDFQPIIDS